jgi:hypothetical protein
MGTLPGPILIMGHTATGIWLRLSYHKIHKPTTVVGLCILWFGDQTSLLLSTWVYSQAQKLSRDGRAGEAFTAHVTAIAQVQHLTTTAQRLLQRFQSVPVQCPIFCSPSAYSWQHDMHPRAATIEIDPSIPHIHCVFSAALDLSLVSACITTG